MWRGILDGEAVQRLDIIGVAGITRRIQGELVARGLHQPLRENEGAGGVHAAVEPGFVDLLVVDLDDQVMVGRGALASR